MTTHGSVDTKTHLHHKGLTLNASYDPQPIHRRRRGTGHQLREVILTVTTDLLAQLGDIEQLTMRAVAKAAQVTAPAVYRHFPDKTTLVREVITKLFTEFSATLTRAAADHHSPHSALHAIAHAYVLYGITNPGHYRVLFSAVNAGPAGLGIDSDSPHPGAESFQQLVDSVAACTHNGDQTRIHLLATQLWASLHGIVDLRITKPEMPWPDAAELTDLTLTIVPAYVHNIH